MRIILLAVCACFLLSPAYAQNPSLTASVEKARAKPSKLESRSLWRPYGPMTAASSAVCFSGVTADALSSRGKLEGNPLFRKSDGTVNISRGMILGYGMCGGTLLIERRWPKYAKALSIVRFITGGLRFGVAIHNSRIPKP